MTETFINEIKMYNEFDNSLRLYIVQFYGITKDPQTEEFMMDLHSGNILQFYMDVKVTKIADLGIAKLIQNSRSSDSSNDSTSENKFHSEAIYISRYMSFTNLTIPRNSTKVQIEDSKVSDSQLIDQHISDDFQSSFDQDYIEMNENVDKIDLIKYYTEDDE
ncbi:uncharacterized protein OCT59_011603 [Rhizophagus irregularis]|uniref:uncharacterized protein n=1 Tax=Rhizophagus irregularis TaxID=588596 RepID=UPI003321F28C|nr:hypothetical protein OCT59_011603 [Rhizophagus irregularis]